MNRLLSKTEGIRMISLRVTFKGKPSYVVPFHRQYCSPKKITNDLNVNFSSSLVSTTLLRYSGTMIGYAGY